MLIGKKRQITQCNSYGSELFWTTMKLALKDK